MRKKEYSLAEANECIRMKERGEWKKRVKKLSEIIQKKFKTK